MGMENFSDDYETETDEELLLSNWFYYQHRELYTSMVEDYLNKRISPKELQDQFFPLWYNDMDRTLTPAEVRSIKESVDLFAFRGFSDILSILFVHIDALDSDPGTAFLSDKKFEGTIREALWRMQENYP